MEITAYWSIYYCFNNTLIYYKYNLSMIYYTAQQRSAVETAAIKNIRNRSFSVRSPNQKPIADQGIPNSYHN